MKEQHPVLLGLQETLGLPLNLKDENRNFLQPTFIQSKVLENETSADL